MSDIASVTSSTSYSTTTNDSELPVLEAHGSGFNLQESITLGLNLGIDNKNLRNRLGLDHRGLSWRVAPGARLQSSDGNHIWLLKAFLERETLSHSNPAIPPSTLNLSAFGIEVDYLYNLISGWLQVGAIIGLGLVHYGTSEENPATAIYNGATKPRSLDGTGLHTEVGATLCTLQQWPCVAVKYVADVGILQGLEGLGTNGWNVSVNLDVMRFFSETASQAPEEIKPQHQPIQDTYANEATALKALIALNAQIFSVGEIHMPTGYPPDMSLGIRFANQMIPLFATAYDHLVTEYLPPDLPQSELDYLKEHRQLDSTGTPRLNEYLYYMENNSIIAKTIIMVALEAGMTIHGGGISLKSRREQAFGKKIPDEALSLETRNHSLQIIQQLAEDGQRVLWYGGAAHNTTSFGGMGALDNDPEASFALAIAPQYSHVELDLIDPRIIFYHLEFEIKNRPIDPEETPKDFIKPSDPAPLVEGVELVERTPDSYSLIYPMPPDR